jgi:hypothetical protein
MNPYYRRFLVAFGASVSIHLLVMEVWFVLVTLNLITGRVPRIPPSLPKQEVPVLTLLEPPRPRPRPMTFVETDSSQESTEKPKEAQFYSDRSTKAAQTKPAEKPGDKPKLEGKQDKVMSSAPVPLPQPVPAPPAQPPPAPDLRNTLAPSPEPKPAPRPKENTVGQKPTELAMLTKEPAPHPSPPKPPAPPKKETTQARLAPRQTERIIPENESRTDSSVSREGIKAFDVAGTPFGSYDRRLIAAVKTRWLALLEQYTIPGERIGQVSLRFHLNEDGSVSELSVAENTAGDILALYCQKAITDSAPFGPWPAELKDLVKRNYRELNFVFYY